MQQKKMKPYLENLVSSQPYTSITFYGNVSNHLNRWLVTSSIGERNRFDLDAILNPMGKLLFREESEGGEPDYIESNWRFYISDDSSSFYRRNSPEKMFSSNYDKGREKYIYCLTSIFCETNVQLLVHMASIIPMPIKMWINGEIVFTGTLENFTKNHIISYHFKEGINTLLVEKPMCAGNRRLALLPKYFSVSVRPLNELYNNTLSNVVRIKEVLDAYLKAFTIYTDKLFYGFDDEIKVLILRNDNNLDNDVFVDVTYSNRDIISQQKIKLGCIQSISIKTKYSQIVKISVNGTDDNYYIFVGNYETYISELELIIEQSSLFDEEKLSLNANLKILDRKKLFIHNSLEPIHKYYSQPVFAKIFLFERQKMENYFSDDINNGFNAYKSPIDRENLNYFLQGARIYEQPVPLIVYLSFDDSSTRFPIAPSRVLTGTPLNTIALTFCGLGMYMNDHINEYEILNVIECTINRYNIDRRRVYLFGICTGARRGYNFINKHKNLFAAFISLAGTPTEIDDINEKYSIPIHQICNIDDVVYNGSTIQKNASRNGVQSYCLHGFAHEEIIDYFSNQNMGHLLLPYNRSKIYSKNNSLFNINCIKNIYLNTCSVLVDQNEMNSTLASLLSQPLKFRARQYLFPIICHDKIDNIRNTNIIIIINIRRYELKIPIEIADIVNRHITELKFKLTDDFFIINLEEHPFNNKKRMLLIIHSGAQAEAELVDLWSGFDKDKSFLLQKIIFFQGHYVEV